MAFLIDDILLAPINGMIWLSKQIRDKVEEQLEDTPEKLQRELLDLQMALEIEEITEAEYEKEEKDILERIEALQKEKPFSAKATEGKK